jgi:acetyltransferase-like isoleucine patch superfamily enzyme
LFFVTINYIALKRGRVSYKSFPVIYGELIIKNNGHCELGQNVTFKSKLSSNYVGLTKKCSVFVEPGAKLTIGDNSGFSGISIYCSKSIAIGSYVTCGGNVSIWDTDFHPLDFRERRIHKTTAIVSSCVEIGNDAFLGANSIVLKGVRIGNRSIIGAGSVVVKTVPDDEIWAGNPARFIRKIAPNLLT